MAVDVETDPTFRAGTPQQLFDGGFVPGIGRIDIQVQVTAQSRARNPNTGQFTTSTLATEVRLRTR